MRGAGGPDLKPPAAPTKQQPLAAQRPRVLGIFLVVVVDAYAFSLFIPGENEFLNESQRGANNTNRSAHG